MFIGLCLVSSRLPLSSGSLELSAVGSDNRLSSGSRDTRSSAEMFEGFSVSGTSQEGDVFSAGSVDGELIESSDHTSGSDDSGSGLLGEFECADSELRDIQKSHVVSDGANKGEKGFDSLGFEVLEGLLLGIPDESRKGDGGSVDSRVLESLEN